MSQLKSCKQQDCPVRTNGECLESVELNECPHFYWETGTEEDVDGIASHDEKIDSKSSSGRYLIFPGNELSLSDITIVTHKYPCKLVVILGDLDSGKTTLLGTIFDLFQIGHFDEYYFASSLTQKGFEIRSHLSRVVSGMGRADTERTKTLQFRLLHLGIRPKEHMQKKHLLLSDVSGETIRLARNSSALMKKELEFVKRADHVFYVVDGEKLDVKNRVATILNAELFIQSAISNSIFTSDTALNVLITKLDKVVSESKYDTSAIEVKLNSRFEGQLKSIKYFKIASRPDDGAVNINMGFGIADLLAWLLKDDGVIQAPVQQIIRSKRLFDNYKFRE